MTYYMLNCFGPPDQERTSIHRVPQFENVSWNRGGRIQGAVPTPVRIYLDPEAPGAGAGSAARAVLGLWQLIQVCVGGMVECADLSTELWQ